MKEYKVLCGACLKYADVETLPNEQGYDETSVLLVSCHGVTRIVNTHPFGTREGDPVLRLWEHCKDFYDGSDINTVVERYQETIKALEIRIAAILRITPRD